MMRGRNSTPQLRRGFTLIELIVTLAIIGLLVVSIIPTLGKYSRANNVAIAAQTIREGFAEMQSYATAPDPSICPLRNGAMTSLIELPINAFGFYVAPGKYTPYNTWPAAVLGSNQNNYPYGTNDGQNYTCGMTDQHVRLGQNQFAILALHVEYDQTNPTDLSLAYVTTVGVVAIETLEGQTVFTDQVGGTNPSAPTNPVLVWFTSPSGVFEVPSVKTASANETYLSTVDPNSYQSTAVNLMVKNGDQYAFGAQNFTYGNLTNIAYQYVMVVIGEPDGFTYSIPINVLTGNPSASGKAPGGFNPV